VTGISRAVVLAAGAGSRGEDWFLRRDDPERHARHLARQIEALGVQVTLSPVAA